ncbi:elongation factor G [Fundidesulfovibrio terrae]|uniref:elongation factor G n=1 Tax=Fundidesulfovibrio terrae TaxID=2922866 RepID=UPI001FB03FED|nr:elongation factor G [Fundidesulfovibrio terrae]
MLDVLKNQRTYALIGHGGCGKTSVAEMLLYVAGAVPKLGKIEDGNTALDYEPEEIKRRGSVQPGFATFQWNKNRHFLIDTPGDLSFNGDLGYILAAVDAVIFVVDAVDGVKPLTRKLWQEVSKFRLPTIFLITKMDRDRADYDMALSGIKNQLGVKPFLQNIPIGKADSFSGVVNIVENKAYAFDATGKVSEIAIPADMKDEVEGMRETMMEEIAVCDETLMERYLEDPESVSLDDLVAATRKAVVCGELYPVMVASGLKCMGGQRILDAAQLFFPSPLDTPVGEKTVDGEDESLLTVTPSGPPACFVFKTMFDQFAGQLSVMRVLSGTIAQDAALLNTRSDARERFGSILYLNGAQNQQVKEPVGPGAIIAVAKLKETKTGDTLCDEKKPFTMLKPKLPEPMISYAMAPAEKGDEDKAYQAMAKLLDEDVTLRLTRNEETGDMLISGMGQSHVEALVEKAKRRFKVGVVLKAPTIPYRETVRGKAEVQGRHKKQTGGRGQFGDCWIRMEGKARGEGYEFVDAIVGGSIPRQYIPAVDKGVQEAAARGVLAGYPMVDFRVELFDGSFHTVDSSEMAFKIAGSVAFKAACEKLKIVLLEPIALVSVSIPDSFMGDVIGDLSSRRGKVLGSDSTGGVTEVQAHVPMSEMQEYAKTLGSMTGGQGAFTMGFDHYEDAPPPVAEKVIAEHKKAKEE